MGLAQRHYQQTATLWSVSGSDGFSGHVYSTPSTMSCRWEERQEIFQNFTGEERVSRTVVYMPSDLAEGDYLAEGDLTAQSSPSAAARRVEGFAKSSNLRGMNFTRKAFLM